MTTPNAGREAHPVLVAAHDALRAAVAGLSMADLRRATPCSQWTVAQVIEHAVLDQGGWASAVAGAVPPQGNPFAPTGELPMDVAGYVATALREAAAAWSFVDPTAAEVGSPLPQGVLTARTAEQAAALDAAVHAWDIAVAVDGRPVLADELARAVAPAAHALVEPLRAWGVYAPALAVEPGDGAASALLRYLGRDPEWRPPR